MFLSIVNKCKLSGILSKSTCVMALFFCFFIVCAERALLLKYNITIRGILILGIFVGVCLLLSFILKVWTIISLRVVSERREDNRRVFWISALGIIIPSFIVFLNLYPGTLSCDTPGQLAEALFINPFENLNPLINTLVLTCFVQIGTFVYDVNFGIALYTLFQLTLYAFVAAYCISLFWRKGIHIIGIIIMEAFFAVNPINMIYATGMWKDTFFSILFLLSIALIYDLFEYGATNSKCIVSVIVFFLTSLARNSAWSALLILSIIFVLYGWKKQNSNYIKVGLLVTSGAVLAMVCVFILFPGIGIKSFYSGNSANIEMQQIARTIRDNQLNEDEITKLKLFLSDGVSLEDVSKNYSPSLIDPIRGLFNGQKISKNGGRFRKLWLELAFHYPKSYVVAWIDHTVALWWPGSSSWLWDTRIFENPYGVIRSPIIWTGQDVAARLYNELSKIPGYEVFNTGAMALWICLMVMYLNWQTRNHLGVMLCAPYLAVFAGLMLFCYAPLFRYMYVVFLAKPLMFLFLFISNESEVESSVKKS